MTQTDSGVREVWVKEWGTNAEQAKLQLSLPYSLNTLNTTTLTCVLLQNSSIISFYRQILILVRLVAYPNCYFIIKSLEKEVIAVVPQIGCSA